MLAQAFRSCPSLCRKLRFYSFGSSEYTYEYDDLYRLTTAAGKYTGSNEKHRYSLSMSYNSVGGILQKTQLHERSGSDGDNFKEQKKSSYDNTYAYSQEQPHAPVHIGQQSYTYDANGNQTGCLPDLWRGRMT